MTKIPATGFILSLLREVSELEETIFLEEIVKLAKFKLPTLPLEKAILVI
jgi:hypothetical protein